MGLSEYFRFAKDSASRNAASKESDSRMRRLLKHMVRQERRGTARMLATDLVRPIQRRKAAKYLARRPLLLHLGSGGERKAGWVNVDLIGDPVEVAWNLANGLPFPDDSVDGIFSEHVFEHIPLEAGVALMVECARVLKPGGIMRTGVPNGGALLEAYADPAPDDFIARTRPGRPTRMLAVQELFYWHRHVAMFDFETLEMALRLAGLNEVAERSFGDTSLPVCPDTERRRAETLYVEARA